MSETNKFKYEVGDTIFIKYGEVTGEYIVESIHVINPRVAEYTLVHPSSGKKRDFLSTSFDHWTNVTSISWRTKKINLVDDTWSKT